MAKAQLNGNTVAEKANAVADEINKGAIEIKKRARAVMPDIPPARTVYAYQEAPIWAYQPFKALWVLLSIIFHSIQFPAWLLIYAIPGFRPHSAWTFHQSIRNRIVRNYLYTLATIRAKTPLYLKSGWQKTRFQLIHPSNKDVYKGVLVENPAVKPVVIGGTWYPLPPKKGDTSLTVLHFHGGAFMIGDTRDFENKFLASILTKYAGRRCFLPTYRLSCIDGNTFPAALQDAVSAYQHLLDLGIPAKNIILSGDSAGGNLVLALLRYIKDHPDTLPEPSAGLLWSPWVDVAAARDEDRTRLSPHWATDYIPINFGSWGAKAYIPPEGKGFTPAHSGYISPVNEPFKTVPLWFQCGGGEMLWHDIQLAADRFEDVPGNDVELYEIPHASHDVLLVGHITGWEKQTAEAGRHAREFLKRIRA